MLQHALFILLDSLNCRVQVWHTLATFRLEQGTGSPVVRVVLGAFCTLCYQGRKGLTKEATSLQDWIHQS